MTIGPSQAPPESAMLSREQRLRNVAKLRASDTSSRALVWIGVAIAVCAAVHVVVFA